MPRLQPRTVSSPEVPRDAVMPYFGWPGRAALKEVATFLSGTRETVRSAQQQCGGGGAYGTLTVGCRRVLLSEGPKKQQWSEIEIMGPWLQVMSLMHSLLLQLQMLSHAQATDWRQNWLNVYYQGETVFPHTGL